MSTTATPEAKHNLNDLEQFRTRYNEESVRRILREVFAGYLNSPDADEAPHERATKYECVENLKRVVGHLFEVPANQSSPTYHT